LAAYNAGVQSKILISVASSRRYNARTILTDVGITLFGNKIQ